MSTQQNTEQQPIESAPTKTIKVRNRPLGPKRYYTKESKEMGAPTSLREAVMRAIAEGDYKFQLKDNTSDKTKGLGSHLGYGEKERKQMIGFTASKENGGMPPEVPFVPSPSQHPNTYGSRANSFLEYLSGLQTGI